MNASLSGDLGMSSSISSTVRGAERGSPSSSSSGAYQEILPDACDNPRLSALVTFQVQGGFFAYRRCVGSGRRAADPSGGSVLPARRAPQLTHDEQRQVVSAIADAVRAVGALMEHVARDEGIGFDAEDGAERMASHAGSSYEQSAGTEGSLSC